MPRSNLLFILLAFSVITVNTEISAAGRKATITNPTPDRTWNSKAGGLITPGRSIAVVISITNYTGELAGGFPSLPSARRDADKMIDFLIKEAGFDLVYVLTDEYATKQEVDKLMTDTLPKVVGPRDRFLFYWSGHGTQRVVGPNTFGFLPLRSSGIEEYSAMVSMQDLERWDRYLNAQQTLFVLDTCVSGLAGYEKKAAHDLRLEQLALPARHLLTAGTATEKAISGDRWGGSLFTDSFIRGAKGDARGASGVVSLYSLVDFIQDRVAIEARAANWSNSLTPQLRSLQAGDGAFFFTPASRVSAAPPILEQDHKRTDYKGELPDATLALPPSSSDSRFSIVDKAGVRAEEYRLIRNVTSIQTCARVCTQIAS